MGQMRNAVRAYAALAPGPASVLTSMDRLAGVLGEEELATLAYGVVAADASTLTLASAGHLPLVRLAPDGSVDLVDGGRSVAFGVGSDLRRETVIPIEAGTTLLLFSDGLVEDRRRPLDAGLQALCQAVGAALPDDLDKLCDQVVDAMLAGRGRDDDVTLLAVRTTA
jgi:serine phosphatase RsbU (regulator of sigma subunit)